ncbi:MAG: radical SAM protein [Defluviitaleaceae bacterium]|nr:radical SAM protein [Defluviitaleaceae bacterium]
MRIIKNHIRIPIDGNECILVHTHLGSQFVLGEKEHQTFCRWKDSSVIKPRDEQEVDFYNTLCDNKFLLTSAEEDELEASTLLISKENYSLQQNSLFGAAFILSYACNFSCPYCFENRIGKSKDLIMTRDMVDSILRLYDNSLNYISLFGGEPLLPENKEIIEYIISKSPASIYSVTTNGYFIEEFFPILRTLNVMQIMVTFDGEKEVHDKTRILRSGGETYSKIMNGVELLLENNIRVKIRMNISSNNRESCMSLKNKFIEKYNKAYEGGNLLFEMQPLFGLHHDTKKNLEMHLYYPEVSNGTKTSMRDRDNTLSKTLSPLLNVFSSPKKFIPKYNTCNAETNVRYYDSKGDIYSCIVSVGSEHAIVGKFYPTVEMKENGFLSRNIESIPECRVCKMKFLCGGGCAHAIIEEDGNVLKPNCGQIYNEIKLIPELYAKYNRNVKDNL